MSMFGLRKIELMLAPVVILLFSAIPCTADGHQADQLVLETVEAFQSLQDYTCRLDKRVRKNGVLYEDLSIFVKYKKPRQYYFRWDSGPRKGREVIYAAEKHNGQVIAHTGGWLRFVTLHLDPLDPLVMRENRHSLRHSGLEKVMHLVESNYARAQKNGLDAIRYMGEVPFDGKSVWVLQAIFPENQGYYAWKIILFIDPALCLPVKVTIYDWTHCLMEEYAFHHLKINVGWTDRDFEPDHPNYRFFTR